ncbi:hypothetical protein [Bradyrhizobium murdochi]|uniref:hypothetical protein n=1 Tax=Bradyrhizobium murdochi TaxID=1038859 RepID=UPI0012EB98E6|nr:hypothetical protein [Bradyrhizobium murdochi]
MLRQSGEHQRVGENFSEPAKGIAAGFKQERRREAVRSFGASGQFFDQITQRAVPRASIGQRLPNSIFLPIRRSPARGAWPDTLAQLRWVERHRFLRVHDEQIVNTMIELTRPSGLDL